MFLFTMVKYKCESSVSNTFFIYEHKETLIFFGNCHIQFCYEPSMFYSALNMLTKTWLKLFLHNKESWFCIACILTTDTYILVDHLNTFMKHFKHLN